MSLMQLIFYMRLMQLIFYMRLIHAASLYKNMSCMNKNMSLTLAIFLSIQLSLALACIKALSKTLPNMHGSSRGAAPRLNSSSPCQGH